MGKALKIDLREFKEFEKHLKMLQSEIDSICISLTKEIAARLLSKVIRRTPVGEYGKKIPIKKKIYEYETISGEVTATGKPKRRRKETGKTKTVMISTSKKIGGTLRRGWTVKEVIKEGNNYSIEVINPTDYASYVEFGHRTRNHKGWVQGHFMLTISEKEINENLENIINNKLKAVFKERLG